MQSTLVGQPGTRFAGRHASCCGQRTRPGQSILWHHLEPRAYAADLFIVHTECMAAAVDRAPEGQPVQRGVLEVRRIRQRAARLVATTEGS